MAPTSGEGQGSAATRSAPIDGNGAGQGPPNPMIGGMLPGFQGWYGNDPNLLQQAAWSAAAGAGTGGPGLPQHMDREFLGQMQALAAANPLPLPGMHLGAQTGTNPVSAAGAAATTSSWQHAIAQAQAHAQAQAQAQAQANGPALQAMQGDGMMGGVWSAAHSYPQLAGQWTGLPAFPGGTGIGQDQQNASANPYFPDFLQRRYGVEHASIANQSGMTNYGSAAPNMNNAQFSGSFSQQAGKKGNGRRKGKNGAAADLIPSSIGVAKPASGKRRSTKTLSAEEKIARRRETYRKYNASRKGKSRAQKFKVAKDNAPAGELAPADAASSASDAVALSSAKTQPAAQIPAPSSGSLLPEAGASQSVDSTNN